MQADEPGHRVVTAWHQLPAVEEKIDAREERPTPQAAGNQNQDVAVGVLQERQHRKNSTDQTKRQFVRFNVVVEPAGSPGAQSWRVKVDGQASEWDGVGVPSPLKGAERPYWLDRRIEKLEVEIYEQLKSYAVAAAAPPATGAAGPE
jgi:hypothetical protein